MTIAEQIARFSRWLEGTDIELFELTGGQETIRLRRAPLEPSPSGRGQGEGLGNQTGAPASRPDRPHPDPLPEREGDEGVVRAPSVGVFRRAHPSRPAPLVEPGQRVEAGEPVGLLQIGALLIHVPAPQAGTVLEMLAEDGAAVGYGAALARLSEEA